MEDQVNRLLQKCQVATQLELEDSRPPISCKDLEPILIEFLSLSKKYSDLIQRTTP